MQQEPVTTRTATSNRFDDMTINEIAEELERRLRAIYEEKWPGGDQPRAETVKESVVVHYGPPGHRTKMTRAEALRFLDIIAEVGVLADEAMPGKSTADG